MVVASRSTTNLERRHEYKSINAPPTLADCTPPSHPQQLFGVRERERQKRTSKLDWVVQAGADLMWEARWGPRVQRVGVRGWWR